MRDALKSDERPGRHGNDRHHLTKGIPARRKADFLKIRIIVLGYTLLSEWISSLRINRLALQFQITNPCILWKANKVNVDPETLGVRMPSNYVFTLNVNL